MYIQKPELMEHKKRGSGGLGVFRGEFPHQESRMNTYKQPNVTPQASTKRRAKPNQTHTREEITKIRAKINAVETKKTIQSINASESWFFEKVNKIDNSLANLIIKRKA